ncbi:MAG: hypothetical protein JWN63_2572 [Candidatus Acidoferrum typicum]|nr:hypothetical protein [Candidatus Acidoferrum typicum]
MAAPTTIIVTYLVYSAANPAVITTATVTLPLPSAGGTQSDDTLAFVNIMRAGGIRFTDTSGVSTFIPIGMITKIIAQ